MTSDSPPSGKPFSSLIQIGLPEAPISTEPTVSSSPMPHKPQWLFRVIVNPESDKRVLETFWISPDDKVYPCKDCRVPPSPLSSAAVAKLVEGNKIQYLVSRAEQAHPLDEMLTLFEVEHYFHTTSEAEALRVLSSKTTRETYTPPPTISPPPPAPSL